MYPGFDEAPKANQPPAKKKAGGVPKEVQEVLNDLKDKFSMKSVKPLLGAYQVYFQMSAKTSPINPLPLKAVFFQGYPADKPRLYVTRALGHRLISQLNGQIKYEEILQWTPKTRFIDLLNKLQTAFNTFDIKEDPFTLYVQEYRKRLQQYARDVNNLSNTNIPQNPPQPFLQTLKLPQPPVFNFDYIIKQKKYHQNLQNNVLDNIEIYNTLVDDYKEAEAKAKYIGEKFGKGRILKEIETAMEGGEPDLSIEGLENQLADYHAKRKNYHKMQIFKNHLNS